jgi:hypothetical protein
MKDCWWAATAGQSPWEMTLPVVKCDEHAIGNCPVVVGAVTVQMLMMTGSVVNKPDDIAPTVMNDPDDPNFPSWDYSTSCSTFTPFVGQSQDVVLPQLPGQDYTDPWLIYDRWDSNKGNLSTKAYSVGMARWDCFVNHFQLKNSNGKYAPLALKSMYFMPDCEPHAPKGETGGPNFGILAEYPVLVE